MLGWINTYHHIDSNRDITIILNLFWGKVMKRAELLRVIATHQDKLKELGVKSLNLFGSVARDEARSDSDVDFLVEFDQPGGFFQLLQVQYYLEDILGCPVDLGTEDALREHLREPILKDIIRAF